MLKSRSIHAADQASDQFPDKYALAKRYNVSPRTIARWTKDRLIPSIQFSRRTFRYRWSDVERAIKRLTVEETQ